MPERSVPVSGFSRELREATDVERFRFAFPLAGGPLYPVHVVFSPSQRTAEIKAGDLKALRVTDVGTVEEARARWVAWWRAGQRKAAFAAPRRVGRRPAAAPSPP